ITLSLLFRFPFFPLAIDRQAEIINGVDVEVFFRDQWRIALEYLALVQAEGLAGDTAFLDDEPARKIAVSDAPLISIQLLPEIDPEPRLSAEQHRFDRQIARRSQVFAIVKLYHRQHRICFGFVR